MEGAVGWGAQLLALATAHRVISAPAAAGTQKDQPAVSKKNRTDEVQQSVPASSQTPCLACLFLPFVAACITCSSPPYPVWLFTGTMFPQPAIMSSKWRLLMPETGSRADAQKRHREPMRSSEAGSQGI